MAHGDWSEGVCDYCNAKGPVCELHVRVDLLGDGEWTPMILHRCQTCLQETLSLGAPRPRTPASEKPPEEKAQDWFYKGVAFAQKGLTKEAISCYDRALELDPALVEAWDNKGVALDTQGDLKAAMACFDRALQMNEKNASAWCNKGYTLSHLGRLREAIACYDKALAIHSEFIDALYNKGCALANLGRLNEALLCFDRVLQINPGDEEAMNTRRLCLEHLRRTQRRTPNKVDGQTKRASPKSEVTAYWQLGDMIESRWEVHDIKGGPGRSGMGIVYIVYDHETHEVLAAKTIQERFVERFSEVYLQLFIQEIQTWINLDRHPNIVQAAFAKTCARRPLIFMEPVLTRIYPNTLRGWITSDLLGVREILRFAIQFCRGMEHTQTKGVKAHGDIKPENIMITDTQVVKITDFGLTTFFSSSDQSALRAAPVGAGTPAYMAPEQFTEEIDIRADIYAFGIMLYEMIAGSRPFSGRTRQEYQQKHSTWQVKPASTYARPSIGRVPCGLDQVIIRCLAKKPCERFDDFEELRLELESILYDFSGERLSVPPEQETQAEDYARKGASLVAVGLYEDGLKYLDESFTATPTLVFASYARGYALAELGQIEEAVRCFDRCLDQNAEDATAWHGKGVVLGKLPHKQKEALACFEQAVKLVPKAPRVLSSVGYALSRVGRPDEGIGYVERALALNDRDPDIWLYRGHILSALERFDEAIESYDRAIDGPKKSRAVALADKGNVLRRQGKLNDAMQCYNEALNWFPDDPVTLTNKGGLLGQIVEDASEPRKQIEEALSYFDKALAIDPEYLPAWKAKMMTLGFLGRLQEALEISKVVSRLQIKHWTGVDLDQG